MAEVGAELVGMTTPAEELVVVIAAAKTKKRADPTKSASSTLSKSAICETV